MNLSACCVCTRLVHLAILGLSQKQPSGNAPGDDNTTRNGISVGQCNGAKTTNVFLKRWSEFFVFRSWCYEEEDEDKFMLSPIKEDAIYGV